LLVLALASAAPAAAAPPTEASCRAFVQKFYDQYRSFAQKEHKGRACDLAVRARPSLFSPELRRRLEADSAAQARSKEEIVGLDFDPFLNAQDFASRYVVRNVVRHGQGYRAEVYGSNEGKQGTKPDVMPELVRRGSGWMFVSFHYPGADGHPKSDLLSVLRQLREDRRKGPR